MKIGKSFILFVWIAFVCRISLFGQIDSIYNWPKEDVLLFRFEELVNDDESNREEIEENLLEDLEKVQHVGAININALTYEMAMNYLHLTEFQYYQLMSYLAEYGEMMSIYELSAVEGFSYEDVRRLTPLLAVEAAKTKGVFFKNFFRKSKNSLLLRYGQVLERSVGYDKSLPNHYLGSAMRLAFRYQFSTQDKLVIAISGEKDAGEQFFRGAQKYGFDFYSAYICLKNIGVLKKLVVGDFKLDFGQGLLMGSSLMRGKGGGVEEVRRFAGLITPSAPLNEGKTFRGGAVTIGNHQCMATVFAAYRQYDGNVLYNEDSTLVFEGSLNNSGYHRTIAEQNKRNNNSSGVFGADIMYRHSVFRIGARAFYTLFENRVQPTGRPYQQYAFTGKGLLNASVDYQVLVKKVVLFGEVGVSDTRGWAFVQGATLTLSSGVSFAVVGHYYDKRFVSLYGIASNSSQGEWGFYLTSQWILAPKLDLVFYYDYTNCSWLRYRVDMPDKIMRTGMNLSCSVNGKNRLFLRYQYKKSPKNKKESTFVNGVEPFHTSKIRLIGEFNPLYFLKLKTEAAYLINHSKTLSYQHDGLLLYQDVGLEMKKMGLNFHFRIAFFDTDTYEERLYAYENDLYYSFTVNPYYDKGYRMYFLVNYAYKCFHFWIKMSQTYYLNKEEIGSGLDLIRKKHKTELKIQLMLKW
jgi:hypothetical protein